MVNAAACKAATEGSTPSRVSTQVQVVSMTHIHIEYIAAVALAFAVVAGLASVSTEVPHHPIPVVARSAW